MKEAIAPGKTTKTKKTNLGFGELGLRHEAGGGPSCGPDLSICGIIGWLGCATLYFSGV
jgi:hypothetical protein